MAGNVRIDRRLPENMQAQTGPGTDVQSKTAAPSYYDIAMLQRPVWEGWTIGSYFFFGGLSGGAYLLGRMAELFGGRQFRDVRKAGTTVALLASLPIAPLLIIDLGDRKRFHHMLRVFKPSSPMSLGSWVITGYSGAVGAAVLREYLRHHRGEPEGPSGRFADQSLALIANAAGIPLALMMTTYTGVLLSGTATPVWSRSKWLAPLFSASAIGNGAAAINLALQLMNRRRWPQPETVAQKAIAAVSTGAHTVETVLLAQYLTSLGRLNKPLTSGKQVKYIAASTGSFVASEVLKHLPLRGRARGWAKITASLLGMAGGYALKYGITEAGKTSAADPEQNRISSTPGAAPKYLHPSQSGQTGKLSSAKPLPRSIASPKTLG